MDDAIRNFMTCPVLTIGARRTMEEAHRLMREHGIRHLPVTRGGEVVGVVSQRDLHLVETFKDVDPAEVLVEEAMSADLFAVHPDTRLGAVAEQMARHKYGCAVVLERNELVGIFTTVDALKAIQRLLASSAVRRALTRLPNVATRGA